MYFNAIAMFPHISWWLLTRSSQPLSIQLVPSHDNQLNSDLLHTYSAKHYAAVDTTD